jgi:hypothetical protein
MPRFEGAIGNDDGVSEPLEIRLAAQYIGILNENIHRRCPFINVSLHQKGYMLQTKGFISYAWPLESRNNYILCLNIKGVCVSSIEIAYSTDDNQITMISATGINFIQRGYNTFLRAVLVKVAGEISIGSIFSLTENPISATLQIRLGAVQTGNKTILEVNARNISLAEEQIRTIIGNIDDRFCFDATVEDFAINPLDEGNFYINSSAGGKKHKRSSRRNKRSSRRNKRPSRRNKRPSRRNKRK